MRRTRKSAIYKAAVIASVSIALLTFCQTTEAEAPIDPVEIRADFPTFPDPEGYVELTEGGEVVMPLEYWMKITEYVIDVRAVEQTIKEIHGTSAED